MEIDSQEEVAEDVRLDKNQFSDDDEESLFDAEGNLKKVTREVEQPPKVEVNPTKKQLEQKQKKIVTQRQQDKKQAAPETNYNQIVMKFDEEEYDSDKLFGYDSNEDDI